MVGGGLKGGGGEKLGAMKKKKKAQIGYLRLGCTDLGE